MINTFTFLSNEIDLVYAMPFRRSEKTRRVIKSPEIELIIRKRPYLVLDHKIMWRMLDLMDPKTKFSYSNYMTMIDEESENFTDLIQTHLDTYSNVLYYGVTENDVLKEIAMDKGYRYGVKTKIVLSGIGQYLSNEGYDFSLSYTKFGLTALYIKGKRIIEFIVGPQISHICTRLLFDGVWIQPLPVKEIKGHISVSSAVEVTEWLKQAKEKLSEVESYGYIEDNNKLLWQNYAKSIQTPMEGYPQYENMSFDDRNLLEHDRFLYVTKTI